MNKIIIDQSALAALINRVLGVVSKRSLIPILSNVLIVTQDDTLTITGFDMETELSASMTLPESPQGQINTTAPAHKLAQIVKSAPHGTMTLTQDDECLIVRAGRSRWTLATLPATDYPCFGETSDEPQTILLSGKELSDAIKKTLHASGRDDVRHYLNGINIEMADDGALCFVATDGHRLATHQIAYRHETPQKHSWIVPFRTAQLIDRIIAPDDECRLMLTKSALHLDLGTTQVKSKLIDGTYPDWRRVIPHNHTHSAQVSVPHLRDAIHRTAILSADDAQGIFLRLASNEITIETNGSGRENASELIDLGASTITGDEVISIGLNARYILDALSAIDTDKVDIHFTDAETAMMLRTCAGSESICIIMPMRL